MPIGKEQFLNQFTRQALDERISLFVGAGGSCDAGYPSWAELFRPFAKELGTPIDEFTDFYRMAQYYSNCFGHAELRKRINERVNKYSFESPLLEELMNVGFSNIWTTNFDNAIEYNYQKHGILINKVFRDSDFTSIDIKKRVNVFKMNGDASNLEGIVATQGDYERYTDTHKVMLMFFKRELISSTFLFIGYSFTDHLVLECISEVSRYLDNSANYHYTIMKRNDSNPYFEHFINDIEQRYHIRVLLVDDYSEICSVLYALNEKIRSKRVFISGAYYTLTNEITQYSHNLSRSLTSSLLDNDYRIVNGIGRHFGTHLIGYANEHLVKQGIRNIEKHLIIKAFVGIDEGSNDKKRYMREEVIKQCGAAVFVFGEYHSSSPNAPSGVMEEFEIAQKLHKVIIPIVYPGMASEKIWETVKATLTRYPYLEGRLDMLTWAQPTDALARVIVHILDSVQTSI